ncbi:MAG: hypothetical protein LBE82_12200 [Chitinophagaceae bacterium]|nr:hypothetical protein [Chitinophagaceae bacterium]
MGKIFLARVRVADGLNKTISGSTINAARFKDLLIDEEAEKNLPLFKTSS